VLTKDTHETVIRFAPPLTIEREQLDWGIDVFAEVLREVASAPAPARGSAPLARAGTLTR
jgi:acetylornithine/succinyldiaminopimelate/putrescine aminotransferase